MTEPSKAVFLSYASQDAVAAARICTVLRQAGIEVWFDQSELRGGEVWDQRIRREIRECMLFIPVISANTASRHEGYFRLEWDLADRRTHMMARDRAFIVPVCLDATAGAGTDVPESFHRVQWTRLPGGETPPEFAARIAGLLIPEPVPNTDPRPGFVAIQNAGATHPAPPQLTRIVPLTIAAFIVLAALAYLALDKPWLPQHGIATPPSTEVPASTPSSTALAPSANGAGAFAPPPHSIAVLPFVNMSGDPKQEYFSDGITEELLNALSRLNDLQVVARTSSFSFKGQNVDVASIAHKLNVASILEGSVRRAGNTVRITAQLINALNGFHLWSQSYDRSLTDIFKVQSEVATAVARQLQIQLAGDEIDKLALGGTNNADAYDAYLQALELLSTGDTKESDMRAGLASLDRAVALDPNYALAEAKRSATLGNLAIFVDLKSEEIAALHQQALHAAQKAVAMAPELSEAHLALGSTYAYDFLDFARAAPEFERALNLAPGSARVQAGVAGFTSNLGHFEGAIKGARIAVTLDPQNVYVHITLAQVLFEARRYDEAMAALQAAKALRPNSTFISMLVAYTLLYSGRYEEARQLCDSPAIPPQHHGRLLCLASAYYGLGRKDDADRALKQYKVLPQDQRSSFSIAALYARWGKKKEALEYLNQAWQKREPAFQSLKVYPAFDSIRDMPEFKAIESELNLPP